MFQAIHKRVLLATLVGVLAWSGPLWLIALSLLFPGGVSLAPPRTTTP